MSTISPEFAQQIEAIRQNQMMAGRDPYQAPEVGGDAMGYLSNLWFGGGEGHDLAPELAGQLGITPEQFNDTMSATNERTASKPHGVLGAISGIGNYVKENPALLFAAPFAVAGLTGAFGAGAGSAASGTAAGADMGGAGVLAAAPATAGTAGIAAGAPLGSALAAGTGIPAAAGALAPGAGVLAQPGSGGFLSRLGDIFKSGNLPTGGGQQAPQPQPAPMPMAAPQAQAGFLHRMMQPRRNYLGEVGNAILAGSQNTADLLRSRLF